MGAYYHHRCDRCGYTFETSGPWEFFEAEHRRMHHPGEKGTCSDPAERLGTLGLSVRVYCPGCRSLVNLILAKHVILARLDEPSRSFLETLWTSRPEGHPLPKAARLPPCPRCGSDALILDARRAENTRCPRCGAGTLLALACAA